MSDLHERVEQELHGRERQVAKKRDSKVLTFILIMAVVFGLMFAFLYYTNQNLEPGGSSSGTQRTVK